MATLSLSFRPLICHYDRGKIKGRVFIINLILLFFYFQRDFEVYNN